MAIEHRRWDSVFIAIGCAGILAGIASGFEILLVGEELSTLGDRAHSLFRFASGSEEYFGKLTTGLLAVGISIARAFWVVGFCQGRPWAFRWGAGLSLPFALLDLACWSLPLVAIPLIADAFLFGRGLRGARR